MRRFLQQRKNSFGYAWQGLIIFFRNEIHARIHLVVTLIVLTLGWVVELAPMEWVAVIISIGLVVQAEIWNTAIEKLSNIVQPERDPRIKVVKDLAASGVLWCTVCAIVIGMIVFFPYIAGWK